MTSLSIVDHFASLQDPRREHCKLHLLPDILTLALCAVIAGANTWEQIELFGRAKKDWLKGFLRLANGIPSHDTIRRVFCLLKPSAFEACFVSWMNAACEACGLQRIHIDGKSLRGSRRNKKDGLCRALHLVSAWAGANHLTLGQVAVDDKSNEITAIPKLLELLELKGCIITLDAMGCQKDLAEQIVDGGGDYVFTVKENQGRLSEDIKALLERALNSDFAGLDHDFFQTEEQGHGRQERRTYLGIYNPPALQTADEWKGLSSVVIVTRERQVGDKETVEQHYYISSCKKLRGPEWAEVIRGHWSIENNLHWVLDVIFKEDQCRTQDVNAASNLALLRKIAVSLLKCMPEKYNTGNKRMYAAWDEDYLEQILTLLSVKEEEDQPSPPQQPSPSLQDASIS